MQSDRLQLALRPRPAMEALDLGLRLAHQQAPVLLRVYAPIALVVGLLCLSGLWLSPWLPSLMLWLLKPWLDRVLLQVFSRAVFGQRCEMKDVLTGPLLFRFSLLPGLLVARLSPWRAFTQPVAQLEGLRGEAAKSRRQRLLNGQRGRALLAQQIWFHLEAWLSVGLLWLVFLANPLGPAGNFFVWMQNGNGGLWALCLQLPTALLLEVPFVAGGFAMYLNRRVELESWDVEQELRHAFAA